MIRKFLLIVFLSQTSYLMAQNTFVGKWIVSDIKHFNDRYDLSEEQKNNFESIIIFNEDYTLTKITNGIITEGKYALSENKLYLYKKNDKGVYEKDWLIRWPKNISDPCPETPEIDFIYPESFQINGKPVGFDVYYVKEKTE